MVMLVLNARFALLAAYCSLATITSTPWVVDAAAIQPRPFDHDHCHNVTSDQPSSQYVLPLPLKSKTKQFKVRTHEWLYSNSVALLTDIVFTRLKRDDNTPGEACRFRKHGDYRFPAGMTRRSVLIPNNHGSEYIVSHSRRQVRRRRRRPKARRLNGIEEMPLARRAQDLRVGYVAIMSPNYNSATGREIAKLFAAPKGHEASVLYASETNQTQFRLVDAPVSVESTSDLTPVTLEMGATGETRTCATYNSSPPQDESDVDSENMTMEPCANRATPEASHKSQIFMYNGTSGALEPTWNSADSTNTTAASPSVNQNSTSSSNATATSSAVQAAATLFANRADNSQNPTKQNSTVSLVFTPIKAIVTDVGTQENSTTTGTTMTKTKTVTVFDLESTSTRVPSSTSNTAAQVLATSSALDVQLVGAPIPSSNATGTGSTSVSTTSSTATGLINASAIASRIAASAASSATVSSTTTSSSTDSALPSSSTQAAQRRENERLVAYHVGTEPYTWMFKSEER